MQPKALLFVVDSDTMPVHIQRGFCGIVSVPRLNRGGRLNGSYFGQVADLMNVSADDLVFFYMLAKKPVFNRRSSASAQTTLQQGYYGVFEVCGPPFLSEEQVAGFDEFEDFRLFGSRANPDYAAVNARYAAAGNNRDFPVLRFRIPIEPIPGYMDDFHRCAVDDNHAYVDRTDEGQLNTLLYKKIKRAGEERSITPILPEEASKISRLLFKASPQGYPLDARLRNQHRSPNADTWVALDVEVDAEKTEFMREQMLEAYILRALNQGGDLGDLRDHLEPTEDIDFCGNQVQYGISGNKVDILLLYRQVIGGSTAYRYRATVIELKKGAIVVDSVAQLVDYQRWIAQLVTYNNVGAIQPILVGKRPSRSSARTILEVLSRSQLAEPVFVEYSARDDENVTFREYDIREVAQI